VVIPVPRDWSGSSDFVAGFQAKYGVKVVVIDAFTDAAEMSSSALDVYQVAVDTAASHTARFAPYLVFYWLEIPAALKNAKAYWYGRCGGYIAVGYSKDQPAINSLSDLLEPGRMVSIAGEPTISDSSLDTVVAAGTALGGTPDNPAAGIDFFKRLKGAGNLVQPIDSPAPVHFAWNYELLPDEGRVPLSATVGAYDIQAVSRAAPHPAAARLWEEYLLSDTGQNLCLHNGERPARMDAMRAEGVIDVAAAASIDPWPVGAVMLTPDELAADRAYVAQHWNSDVGCIVVC
jgi:putative spermidine/putrescine transport system substrate-binding protein